jgi:hypothetical protein
MKKTVLLMLMLSIFLSVNLVNFAWGWGLYIDGNTWRVMTYESKTGFVAGLNEGLTMGLTMAAARIKDNQPNDEQLKNMLFYYTPDEKMDIKQIVEGLDKFYSDYANKKIPGFMAYPLVLKRMKGYPEGALQKEVEAARKGGTELGKITK